MKTKILLSVMLFGATMVSAKELKINALLPGNALLDSLVDESNYGKTKSAYSYDHNNIPTGETFSYWGGSGWILSSKGDYTCDDKGNITLNVSSYWKNDHWEPSFWAERAYNEQGLETLYLYKDYNAGAWVLGRKTETDYNADGKRVKCSYYEGKGDEWEIYEKFEYTYNSNYTQGEALGYKIEAGEWVAYEKLEISFDAKGNQIQQKNYFYDSDKATWVLNAMLANEYMYDSNGFITQHISSQTNYYGETPQLEYKTKFDFTNDEFGNATKCITSDWNEGTSQWDERGTTNRYYRYVKSAISSPSAQGTKVTKILRGGQLLIDRGGKLYDVSGTIIE